MLKAVLIIIGMGFTLYGLYDFLIFSRHRYSHAQLFEDLRNMNQIGHPFSIVAIKDTYHEYPNRFLVYYEPRWKCRLFLYFRTQSSAGENILNIKQSLSNQLKIDSSDIDVQFRDERIYTKYSVSDQIKKVYDHSLYLATIRHFPELSQNNSFEIDGVHYYWMSLADMERDPAIQARNMDVVSFVRDCVS